MEYFKLKILLVLIRTTKFARSYNVMSNVRHVKNGLYTKQIINFVCYCMLASRINLVSYVIVLVF